MKKRRVVGRMYGIKYNWKGHKCRNKHKNRMTRSGQARLLHVFDINRNIPTKRRWARGDKRIRGWVIRALYRRRVSSWILTFCQPACRKCVAQHWRLCIGVVSMRGSALKALYRRGENAWLGTEGSISACWECVAQHWRLYIGVERMRGSALKALYRRGENAWLGTEGSVSAWGCTSWSPLSKYKLSLTFIWRQFFNKCFFVNWNNVF